MMKRLVLGIVTMTILLAAFSVAAATEIKISGKLQRTVEPGGWLITGEKKYLLLNSRQYVNESWFKEGVEVYATGETRNVITTYMEGIPFEATSVHPAGQANNKTDDSRRVTRVLVTGDSTVQAQPDTAILNISVVTQAKQAIEAQQQNATKSDATVRALKAIVGSSGEVKTTGYNLQPQRIYKEGQPPAISGYEARNTVTVTMRDLTKVGTVIDAAGQAGANDVGSVSFVLRQDRPAKDMALKEATREAMEKAQVIAQALGGRVSRVVEVKEGGYQRPPQPVYQAEAFMKRSDGAPTPIEVGSLEIRSNVELIAEIETNQ